MQLINSPGLIRPFAARRSSICLMVKPSGMVIFFVWGGFWMISKMELMLAFRGMLKVPAWIGVPAFAFSLKRVLLLMTPSESRISAVWLIPVPSGISKVINSELDFRQRFLCRCRKIISRMKAMK